MLLHDTVGDGQALPRSPAHVLGREERVEDPGADVLGHSRTVVGDADLGGVARLVEGAEGPGVVRAYSPVTDETYAMTCEAGDPAVCRGGNNAAVYIYD